MQEELEEIKQDRRKKKKDMSIEEMRHEQQLVDYKIKDITNDLGYKRFRGEKIDEEYERDCEIRIRKLKQDFNEWGSEVRKKEQAYNEEHYSAARRRMLSIPFVDKDDYIPLGDIIDRYSTIEEPSQSQGSSRIDFLSEEFTGEFTSIPPRMDEDEFDKEEVDCYDHDISSDDDSYENIEYVEASPLNLEYDNLKEGNEDQEEKEFDLEDIFQIQDVILREKLLNVHRLITNIESLKNNSTPDHVFKFPSSVPISVTDSGSFFEESDTSLSHSDNSLPEFETFNDHTEETRSGKLPEFESFYFDDPSFPRPPPEPPDVEICLHFEPDAPVIDNFNKLNDDQRGGEINVEDDDSFTFVIRTFLPFLTYPKISPLLSSAKNKDTIFDPGISTYSRRLLIGMELSYAL
ncbi:hypothetical protein Tco_1410144, partial [Tanacetum coccineum]